MTRNNTNLNKLLQNIVSCLLGANKCVVGASMVALHCFSLFCSATHKITLVIIHFLQNSLTSKNTLSTICTKSAFVDICQTVSKQIQGERGDSVKQSACFKGATDVPLRSNIVSTLMECNISGLHIPRVEKVQGLPVSIKYTLPY